MQIKKNCNSILYAAIGRKNWLNITNKKADNIPQAHTKKAHKKADKKPQAFTKAKAAQKQQKAAFSRKAQKTTYFFLVY